MTASFSDSGSVIVAGARTPTGRFRGALSSLPATELGAVAIRAALERTLIPPASVGYVIMGQVVTAGAGQNPARIAAIEAGIPMSVPAITINKVCLSAIDAIILADRLVRAGDYDMVVAGGMESMSQAPHLPSGFGYGDVMVHDALELDGLRDYFTHQSMGALTEVANARHGGVGRAEQDAFAAASHTKAAKAWKDSLFADEVVPVSVPNAGENH